VIHGILCKDGTKEDHLIFKCPNCGKSHGCFTTTKPNHYHNGFTNVWSIKETITGDKRAILDIHPSFDYSKICGWHGPYNWQVDVMILEIDDIRNENTETWLDLSS